MKKPKDPEEYKDWLYEQHQIEISRKIETHYESAVSKIRQDLENSDIWIELIKNLNEYGAEYHIKYKYPLLMPGMIPKLYTKPFNSLIEKAFRKDILENKNWPKPSDPEKGWITPSNWFFRINDIIRTMVVVKYLDGIGFIADKIRLLSEKYGLEYKIDWEARDVGYYAAHQYIKKEFEIPNIDWNTEKISTLIEIQITTQLQENIRSLLHKHYEERRKRVSEEDTKWQWNYKSEEFAANYLGHILHYVEGMILEIRDKQEEKI